MDDDLYCKVYLQSDIATKAMQTLIATILEGRIDGRTIESKNLQVDLFENRFVGQPASAEDFVRWPFYLEIGTVSANEVKLDAFVIEIAALLRRLRETGVRSMASCDFEEQLLAAMA